MKESNMVRLLKLNNNHGGYWQSRILSQIKYACKLSEFYGCDFDALLQKTSGFILEQVAKEGAITKNTALAAESMMTEMSSTAKKLKVCCVSHAHLDMNWLWRWDETVAVALDIFKTMLDLMDEYPEFTFSQSQASMYKILAEHDPDMLQKVKQRIREGRWEVTAATWVEGDKNMPCGESLVRQILYTKKYLPALLGIDPDELQLDFEPDTFGHSLNVPEILSSGGIKYYYHCRGNDTLQLYKWVSPSGKSILVHREPDFYFDFEIKPDFVFFVPEFCSKNRIDTALKVYGVGDHGGGPSRRDIERLIDMKAWPVFPELLFSTYREYFTQVEKIQDKLPVVTDEINFVFTGCYTTQSSLKKANRTGEIVLGDAESVNTISNLAVGFPYQSEKLEEAWRDILFNQFHDILPGSGTNETSEYALGIFQNAMAAAGSVRRRAIHAIAEEIDISAFIKEEDCSEDNAMGAGAGFGTESFRISQCGRGEGKTRIFHVFNTLPYDREEFVEVVVWNWQGNPDLVLFTDDKNNVVEHQLLHKGLNEYWHHYYFKVLLKARAPACGYSTYVMTESDTVCIPYRFFPLGSEERMEREKAVTLENEFVKITFDRNDFTVTSFIEKGSGEEMIGKAGKACFRLNKEVPTQCMPSAWIVGQYLETDDFNGSIRLKEIHASKDSLKQWIEYRIKKNRIDLNVTVSLYENSPNLHFDVEGTWFEIPELDDYVSQLGFFLPIAYDCNVFKYNIPFGTIERRGMHLDVPANSWVKALRNQAGKKAVMLYTDSKHGFRCTDNAITATLIRTSYFPNKYSDLGKHKFRLVICLVDEGSNIEPTSKAALLDHPLDIVSAKPHKGALPASQGFIYLIGEGVAVSAIKMRECQSNAIVIRLYETENKDTRAVIKFYKQPVSAYFVDINENKINADSGIDIGNHEIAFNIRPSSIENICVEF